VKTYGYRSRNALILMTACLLLLNRYAATQALSAHARSHHVGAILLR